MSFKAEIHECSYDLCKETIDIVKGLTNGYHSKRMTIQQAK
jgi:hypothetical protein